MSAFVLKRKRQTGYKDKHREKETRSSLPPSRGVFVVLDRESKRLPMRMCVCCEGLGVGIETVCRKWRFQAEPCWQTLCADFLCAERQAHACAFTCTHTRMRLRQARLLVWRAVQPNEWAMEGGIEGRREGGRREFSREQHFPTVWGFDTWLSHIPQACGRPSISTQGEEGGREREEGSTLGACKQYRVMEDRQRVCLPSMFEVWHVFDLCTTG